jgi:amino acid transporter
MFISAMRLRRSQPDHPRGYRAPALYLLAIVGLVSSAAAFLIGFVPSSQFGSGSTALYVLIIGGGLLVIGLLIPFVFLWLRKPGWKNAVPALEGDEE